MHNGVLCNTPEDKKAQIRDALEKNNGKLVLLSIKKEWLDKIASGKKTMGASKFLYGWYVSNYVFLDCSLDALGVKRAPQSWQYVTLEL